MTKGYLNYFFFLILGVLCSFICMLSVSLGSCRFLNNDTGVSMIYTLLGTGYN